jgi:hypothetical protein
MPRHFPVTHLAVIQKCLPRRFLKKVVAIFWLFLISGNLEAQLRQERVPGKTLALFTAIRSGSAQQLDRQLADGANVNDSLNSYSALMATALCGAVEQMKILIGHGAQVNSHPTGPQHCGSLFRTGKRPDYCWITERKQII